MSGFGGPIPAGLAGASGAQEHVGRTRDRKERQQIDASRRLADAVELRVAGVEDTEAVHRPSENDSEEAHQEHQAADLRDRSSIEDGENRPPLDVTG